MDQTLIDTRSAYDAGALGYDGPADPAEDGEGLIVEYHPAKDENDIPSMSLIGPNGEVALYGLAEMRAVAKALAEAVAMASTGKQRAA